MQIMNIYDEFLGLENERKKCVRKPKPFVGCICRYQVKGSNFQTLDKIKVYQKDILPPGKDMTVYKVEHGMYIILFMCFINDLINIFFSLS